MIEIILFLFFIVSHLCVCFLTLFSYIKLENEE